MSLLILFIGAGAPPPITGDLAATSSLSLAELAGSISYSGANSATGGASTAVMEGSVTDLPAPSQQTVGGGIVRAWKKEDKSAPISGGIDAVSAPSLAAIQGEMDCFTDDEIIMLMMMLAAAHDTV